MDKMSFASYKFKPSDVIEGLNRYFAEAKANRYLRVQLEIRSGVCWNNPDCVKDIVFTNNHPDWHTISGRVCCKYYLICDPEEVVGVAINWLREEHGIFYRPGMNEPPIKDPDDIDDFCVDDAAKEYEQATRKDLVPIAEVREALGIAEDSDIFQCIKYRNNQLETLRTELAVARRLCHKAAEQQKKIDSYESTLSKITDIMEPKYAGPAWSETWDDLVERIKRMKTEHDDVRGLSLKIEELEEQLREASEELSNHRVAEGWLRKDNSDLAIDVANLKEQLRVLRYEILKVYREIFDCSNGDPEGTDEETMQDILTEYKRTLKLKDVAEEKTIKYKELARENEENLARERKWTKKMGDKLVEIQEICER